MAQFTALIIDKPEWDMMVALDPHFKELSFDENKGRYLVLNYVDPAEPDVPDRWMIITPQMFYQMFNSIENAEPIKTYNFYN